MTCTENLQFSVTCAENLQLSVTCVGNLQLSVTCAENLQLSVTSSENLQLSVTCVGNLQLSVTCAENLQLLLGQKNIGVVPGTHQMKSFISNLPTQNLFPIFYPFSPILQNSNVLIAPPGGALQGCECFFLIIFIRMIPTRY